MKINNNFNRNTIEYKLLEYSKVMGIIDIGWFPSKDFIDYINIIKERKNNYDFHYITFRDFINLGLRKSFKTIIVLVIDYFYESTEKKNDFVVSNYSRFCWQTINFKTKEIISFLNKNGYKADIVSMPQRASACLAGLGYFGKNCLFYCYKIGSFVGIQTIGINGLLKDYKNGKEFQSNNVCKNCNICINNCPTNAIKKNGYEIFPLKCISFLNRHSGEERINWKIIKNIPGLWLSGCEVCQNVCPVNKKYLSHHKKKCNI